MLPSPPTFCFRSFSQAFSLIEVVLALAVTSFCLIATLGLFSVGITASRDSNEELQASHLAQSFIDTRRASPTNTISSGFPLPALPLAGQSVSANTTPILLTADGLVTTTPSSALFALNYKMTPAAAGQNYPTRIYLQFYWPAQATAITASGHYELLTFLSAP